MRALADQRSYRAAGLLSIIGLLAGCPAQPSTPPSEAVVEFDEHPPDPLTPTAPANRAAGDELEATLSIAGGGAIELSSLRGRPVLLEISASWEPGFVEAHEFYAELLVEHAELTVIVVVAEPGGEALVGLPDGLTGAWDPAGALAAKLSVATFPTMFVIDRAGHIHTVVNGWSDEVGARLSAAVGAVGAVGAISE